jgi:hypothetical protein
VGAECVGGADETVALLASGELVALLAAAAAQPLPDALRVRRPAPPRAPPYEAVQKLRIVTQATGMARQRMVLERGTSPKLSRRTCTCEYGLQPCRGKSAGVAKRPRELISYNGYDAAGSVLRTAHRVFTRPRGVLFSQASARDKTTAPAESVDAAAPSAGDDARFAALAQLEARMQVAGVALGMADRRGVRVGLPWLMEERCATASLSLCLSLAARVGRLLGTPPGR